MLLSSAVFVLSKVHDVITLCSHFPPNSEETVPFFYVTCHVYTSDVRPTSCMSLQYPLLRWSCLSINTKHQTSTPNPVYTDKTILLFVHPFLYRSCFSFQTNKE